MKRILFLSLLIVLLLQNSSAWAQGSKEENMEPIDYVNVFIGTNAYGHTFPGATLPFGMVQLSPDNGAVGEKAYTYGNKTITGFSHTQLSGTSTGSTTKYANIAFMPTVGPLQIKPGKESLPESGYRSRFSHENEEAHPGYYKVLLEDYNITAELTATKRVGVHRYTFPKTNEGHIVIDITRFPIDNGIQGNAFIEVIGNNKIAGYTTNIYEGGNTFTWYFYAEFSKPFDSFGTFSSNKINNKQRQAEGTSGVGAYINYTTEANEEIVAKVGISFTSISGAKNNLRHEVPGWDFDKIQEDAETEWNARLSEIQVSGSTKLNKIKFYTSLYHTLLFPRVFSDVDGAYYSHFQDSIYYSKEFPYYVDFYLWDTFRAVHPLFTIIEPKRQTEMIKTLLTVYDHAGRIPVNNYSQNFYTTSMIGDHGSTVIIDSYLKGIRGYDIDKAYAGMRKNAFMPGSEKKSREGLVTYKELGYAAADRARESVSLTLEYSLTDWGLAQVAKDLGKTNDYNVLMKRAHNYRNLYDSTTGFIRPRLENGHWLPKCSPDQTPKIVNDGYNNYYDCWDKWWIGVSPNRHYTESNAFQYLWYVPHDIQGLINLMGGREEFVNRLDILFNTSSSNSGPWYVGVTGAIGQYVHGNEPSHHIAYLYNYAGAPWKTQKQVREILETKYGVGPRGLCGQDDMGQMSAWYVFSALGFYPVTPGQSTYQIGSPLFEKAVIDLDKYYGNKKFVIIAHNASGDNKYIQSATLNGEPLLKPWITHEDIINGGRLEFEMGPLPNVNWGSSPEMAPPSMTHK